MKNYEVSFKCDGRCFSVFFNNVVLRERMIDTEKLSPYKCIEFLRRGKEVASFYPEDDWDFSVIEIDY